MNGQRAVPRSIPQNNTDTISLGLNPPSKQKTLFLNTLPFKYFFLFVSYFVTNLLLLWNGFKLSAYILVTENDQLCKKDTTVAISLQRTFTGLNWTQGWKDDQKRLNKPIMALFELNYYFKRLLQYLQEPFRHLLQSVSPNRERTTTQNYPVWFWNSMRLFWKFKHFELHILKGVCLELITNCLVFLYFKHLFLTKVPFLFESEKDNVLDAYALTLSSLFLMQST